MKNTLSLPMFLRRTPRGPAWIAAKNGHAMIIRLLSSRGGADALQPDERDAMGFAPAHVAAMGGHADVLIIMSESGVEIDRPIGADGYYADERRNVKSQNIGGRTPAHIAVQNGKLEVLRMLHALGKSIDGKDSKGNTTLHYTTGEFHTTYDVSYDQLTNMAKLLLECDSEVDATCNEGYTPLYNAVV